MQALQAMRGVQFTVAVTLVADLGALTRFENPTPLMRSLGLTPSEYARGTRRALIEGAWAERDPAKVSRPLPWRWET